MKIAENVGKLRDMMGECMKAMEALHEKCQKAEDEKDEKAKSQLESEFNAKSEEFAKLEKRFNAAKEMARRENVMKEVELLGKTDTSDGRMIPTAGPAQAEDHEKMEREKETHFVNWFMGKSIPDAARDALRPKSAGWDKGATGFALPKRLADAILPERNINGQSYMGKALPLISSTPPGSDLYLKEFRPEVLMYAPEPPRLFDKVMKVPTTRGDVLWPKLVQPAPTAAGTPNEFGEIGAVATAWTAEGSDKPETEPQFTQLEIRCWEVSAYTELTRILISRAQVDIVGLLRELFRASLLHKIDEALFSGDGNGKPTGIVGFPNIGAPARANSGTVSYNDIVELEHAVAPQLRPGAIYIISDSALKMIKELKDTLGRPLYLPNPGGPIFDTINGHQYVSTQRLAAGGTTGDIIFCDPRQYICPVEQEVVIASSEHYKFRENVIAFVCFAQVGGSVAQERGFAVLQ